MWKTILNSLTQRRRRVLGTALAVVLGVSFLVAAMSFGSTVHAAFDEVFRGVNRGTDVVVRGSTKVGSASDGQRNRLPVTMLAQLRAVPGVQHAAAQYRGSAQLLDRHGDGIGGDGPPTIGANWIAEQALSPYRLVEGRAPTEVDSRHPVEVVVDRHSAASAGYHLGDRVRFVAPDPHLATIVGLVTFGTSDSAHGATYLGFAPSTARQLFGDAVDEFRLTAAPGTNAATLRDRIAATLPSTAQALTGAQASAEMLSDASSQFLTMFETVLNIFGAIAVVVAALSIHNTFAILAAQRAREAALLRAVGATRRQVLSGALAEALVVGVVATGGGVGGGYLLSLGLRWVMTATDSIDFGSVATRLPGTAVLAGAAVGIGVTVLAALGPALRSRRIAPIQAMRGAEVEETASLRRRTVTGAVFGAAGAVAIVLATRRADSAVTITALGGVACLVGVVLISPALAGPLARLAGLPLRTQSGRLARANAIRNPRRTAGGATALLVGTAVVMLFATFGSSIKASAASALQRTFGGDLLLHTRQTQTGISPTAREAIVGRPEVAGAVSVGLIFAKVGGESTAVVVADVAGMGAIAALTVRGDLDVPSSGSVVISDYYAREHRLVLGATTTLALADGSTSPLRVAAIVAERHLLGDVAVDWSAVAGHDVRVPITDVYVALRPGVSLAAGAAAVDAAAAPFAAPKAQTREQFIGAVGEEIDSSLAFIYAMLAVAVLIAVLSIATSLALSILERRREIGLLRAVGQSRREVRAMVRWEAVLVAVLGTTLGAALGTLLGWAMMRAIAVQEGWGEFAAPTATLLVIAGLAIVAGALAAWRPARRAARTNIIDALGAVGG